MIALATTIIILLALCLAFFISNPFITLFHELGHAIAHILLTKPTNVDIYVGSYGDKENTIHFKLWKFSFYIKRTFSTIKGGGLCVSNKTEKNYIKRIIVLLAGPLFTVILSVIIGVVIFSFDAHGSIKLYCVLLILFSIQSLYVSLYPTTSGEIYFGNDLDSDGKQFLFVKRLKKLYSQYIESIQAAAAGDYESAIEKLSYILKRCPGEEKILRKLAFYSTYTKRYIDAEAYLLEVKEKFEFSITDTLNLACMQSFNNKHEESILNYRIVLENNSDNIIALNNLGYALSEKGEYSEAQQLLDKAIKLYPETGYLYGTTGYLKILKGDLEHGKSLVDKSIELDNEDAYAYKALGVYYSRLNNSIMAKESFKKVKELDNRIDLSQYVDQVLLDVE